MIYLDRVQIQLEIRVLNRAACTAHTQQHELKTTQISLDRSSSSSGDRCFLSQDVWNNIPGRQYYTNRLVLR